MKHLKMSPFEPFILIFIYLICKIVYMGRHLRSTWASLEARFNLKGSNVFIKQMFEESNPVLNADTECFHSAWWWLLSIQLCPSSSFQMGHSLFPPTGLYPSVHHRAWQSGKAGARVCQEECKVDCSFYRQCWGPSCLEQGIVLSVIWGIYSPPFLSPSTQLLKALILSKR